MRRCLGCMQEYDDKFNVCPHCGYVHGTEQVDTCIPLGTILRGENSNYTIGKVLGRGSFGVTYIAWDNVLERKVAIKEYMPNDSATRCEGEKTVKIVDSNYKQFSDGMSKFIDEARKLAKFQDEEGIVKIYDHFYENETAYIVMEYLDGMTLSKYLEDNGNIEAEMAVDLLMPILHSLIKVHEAGIIHRDIAPDNIMITKDGNLKLIDFGASRYVSLHGSKSLSTLVKLGYSPIEQCMMNGKQGAYTDVYALSAVLYKMITGLTPPDSLSRKQIVEHKKREIGKDEYEKGVLKPINKVVKDVPLNVQVAIYNGMNISVEDRTEDVKTLIDELTSETNVKPRTNTIKIVKTFDWPLSVKVALGVAASVVAVLIVLLATGVINFINPLKKDIVIPEGITRVPSLVNQELKNGEELVTDAELLYTIVGKHYSNSIPKDYILSQDINPGYLTPVNSMISIEISGGAELVEVPDVIGLDRTEGIDILEKSGLKVSVTESYNDYISENFIISQEIEAGSEIAIGSEVEIGVSKGKNPDGNNTEKKIIVPNFVGITYEDAVKLAIKNEIAINVSKKTYSETFDKDIVMSQSVAEGTEIQNSQSISLEISLGIRYVNVPDVQFLTESEAESKLSKSELIISKRYEESETIAAGLVISQSVEEGKKVLPNTTVEVVISKGRGSFEMINVVGMEERKASEALGAKGLQVNKSYAYSSTVASGNVISQSINPGSSVRAGSVVSIVISSGEELFKVPRVIGMKQKDAQSALEKQNFKVSVSAVYSDSVEKDYVISQTLPEGGQYKKGTAIVIEVSLGRQPFSLNFNANGGSSSENNRTIYYNDAYGTLPGASRMYFKFEGWYTAATGGSRITANDKFTLHANQTLYAHWTQDMFMVLNVVGKSQSDAKALLEAQHYSVTVKSVYSDTVSKNYVVSQSLKEGGYYKTGTAITIEVSLGKQPFTLSFNANGGSCSAGSKTIYYQTAYGSLPSASRDYYNFAGWYTAPSGGNLVTSASTYSLHSNQTLYAHWTGKDAVWVKAGAVPSNAKILTYKYMKKTTITNTTGASPGSGYTLVSKTYTGDSLVASGSYRYLDTGELSSYGYVTDLNLDKRPSCGPDEYLVDNRYKRGNEGYIYHWCTTQSKIWIGAWKHGQYDTWHDDIVSDWTTSCSNIKYSYDDEETNGPARRNLVHVSPRCPRGVNLWFCIQIWQDDWKKYRKNYQYKYEKTETISSGSKLSSSGNVTYTLTDIQYIPK